MASATIPSDAGMVTFSPLGNVELRVIAECSNANRVSANANEFASRHQVMGIIRPKNNAGTTRMAVAKA